jgi:multidrug efflux pump subunit AcrB
MVVLMLLGLVAYFPARAGRGSAVHLPGDGGAGLLPGASAQQMAEQVTDKIERTLQEVPHSDIIRSYTKPGESLTILQLKTRRRPRK